jgi:hypothetical protein
MPPHKVARLLATSCPLYAFVNCRRADIQLPAALAGTGDLLSGLPDAIREHDSLLCIRPSQSEALFELLPTAWGEDGLICAFAASDLDLLQCLGNWSIAYLRPSMFRDQMVELDHAPYLRQAMSGVQAILLEDADSASWLVYTAEPGHISASSYATIRPDSSEA